MKLARQTAVRLSTISCVLKRPSAKCTGKATAAKPTPLLKRPSAKGHKSRETKPSGAVDVKELYKASYRSLPSQDPQAAAFKALQEQFPKESLERCLYPGSYIHVVPSLVFPMVLYVDNFEPRDGHMAKFFAALSVDQGAGGGHCLRSLGLPRTAEVRFMSCDLHSLSPSIRFDVLVSLSAPGTISSTCAKFVRNRGFLVANDDHGDASHAMGQAHTWSLVGVLEDGATAFELSPDVLATYFCSFKTGGARATSAQCAANSGRAKSKRPFKWSKNAMLYLFRKKT
eukprot:TRINITY_DN105417_c0_g1_i1.p1 TRINITY_DN105417_c0_g1~~TRINITY_DN105417_c0_g1_i1.p1  ORF type:complete len:285 (-),score=40.88 TRINITY_DN105417_c0_g1_i1:358-1212(-)